MSIGIVSIITGLALVGDVAHAYDPSTDHRCVANCDVGAPPSYFTPAPAPQIPLAGRVAAISGNVSISDAEGNESTLGEGGEIRVGSRITTGPSGHLQIRLEDDTIFTVGPNSEFAVDEFVYDPDSNDSLQKLFASVVKGTFRFITGKIARYSHQVTVKLAVWCCRWRSRKAQISEANVEVDGSGYLKLFSGNVDFQPYDTDKVITLEPGWGLQMLTFSNFTRNCRTDANPVKESKGGTKFDRHQKLPQRVYTSSRFKFDFGTYRM